LCRPLPNSFRREPDPARAEAKFRWREPDVLADSHDLLSTLEQKVAPAHAALLAVDVQNDFVADGGFFDQIGADVKTIQRVIPALAQLVDRAREAGVLVVFIQAIYDRQYLSAPMRERDLRVGRRMPRCLTGSWGADFHVIAPRPNEPVVIKHRYSAFTNPELDDLLKRRGIRSLLLAGVATDTCVESTGRDAYFIDYYVTLVADCCAGAVERDHRVALERFERDYGAVVNSADVIEVWERSDTRAMRPRAARMS
jgi:ureidoacrylate peracid hydrolase